MSRGPQALKEKGKHAGKTNTLPAAAAPHAGSVYLAQVAGHTHVMPGVVIELAIDRLHEGLKCPRTQIDDKPDGAAL